MRALEIMINVEKIILKVVDGAQIYRACGTAENSNKEAYGVCEREKKS